MFLSILLSCVLFNFVNTLSDHPILIVVSYDAFRYNFFEKNANPYMLKLRQRGTYANYMNNVFPTKTFPNHHSIATGLYPENHGVIGNSYFDPVKKQMMKFGYEMFHYDESIVPIWRLNEMAGQNRYSGSMMWPGGQFSYQGKNVTYYEEFNPALRWHKRIDRVISWIEDPEKPANLVMVYFEEPDTHGHAFGPESKTVFNFLRLLDNITFYLEEQLELKGLTDKVNVIHLSDHGMTSVCPTRFINITKYLQPNTYEIAGSTPGLHINPSEVYKNEIYNRLKNASEVEGTFKVYAKFELLSRWRFKNNPRVPPIFLLADEGYGFQDLAANAIEYAKKYNFTSKNRAHTFCDIENATISKCNTLGIW